MHISLNSCKAAALKQGHTQKAKVSLRVSQKERQRKAACFQITQILNQSSAVDFCGRTHYIGKVFHIEALIYIGNLNARKKLGDENEMDWNDSSKEMAQ